MTKAIYTTTLERAGLRLLAGAATGGLGWLALVALPYALKSGADMSWVLAALPIWTLLFVIYLLALTLVGAPVWAALHALRCRGPVSAVIAGGVLSFAAVGSLFLGLADPLGAGAIAAAIGAPVGWVIWRVAYRRVT